MPLPSQSATPTTTLGVNPLAYTEWRVYPLGVLLMSPGTRFRIPTNQRPWSWKNKDLDRLWSDLLATEKRYYSSVGTPRVNAHGNPHYLGSVVMLQDQGHISVVDGQQRLTALSLLAAAMREIASDFGSHLVGQEKAECDLLIGLLTSILETPVGVMPQPRLELDPAVSNFFASYITQPRNAQARFVALNSLQSSGFSLRENRAAERLKRSHEHVLHLVSSHTSGLSGRNALTKLQSLFVTLTEAVVVSALEVKDEPFSYAVFSSLNATGTPLTDVDNIKNELFVLSGSSDYPKIKQAWDRILASVPGQDMETFIRMRHLAFVGPVRRASLYATVRATELSLHKPTKVLDEWETHAALLVDVTLSGSFNFSDEVKLTLSRIKTLNASLAFPPLLVAMQRLRSGQINGPGSPAMKEFARHALLVEHLVFRLLTVQQQDVSKLEEAMLFLVDAFRTGVTPHAAKLQRFSNDADFKHAFSRYSERRTKIQFYALDKLERELGRLSGSGLVPSTHGSLEIEHILPQTPSSSRLTEWTWWRTNPDKKKSYLNRLGNLLAIEEKLNGVVNNYEFSAKAYGKYPSGVKLNGAVRSCYGDSSMLLVKRLLSRKPSVWGVKQINNWQQELADIAVDAWRL